MKNGYTLKSFVNKSKIFFFFYKEIHRFNIPFSILAGLLAMGVEPGSFLSVFLISFTSFGLFLALYLYEIRYGHRYYFYFNQGFSRLNLFIFSFGVNGSIFSIYNFF